jgi:hypothetical protein
MCAYLNVCLSVCSALKLLKTKAGGARKNSLSKQATTGWTLELRKIIQGVWLLTEKNPVEN